MLPRTSVNHVIMSAARNNSLAIICNSLPPYRVHVHQRIAREMPWLKLWSVCTHEGHDARWKHQPPAEINPVDFGSPGDGSRHGLNLASFCKGGRIIEWLKREKIGAVLVLGYNDPGRLRIIRWCASHQVPCFVWGDSNIKGDFATGLRRLVKKTLVSWVMGHVDAVLPCGSLGAAFFERYGAVPKQIFYFPNEPDYDQIRGLSPAQVAEALARFKLDPARKRIVFSGRMIQAKRPDWVVRAFESLALQRPNWDLLMIGDGPMRTDLQTTVPPYLQSRVNWTGFLDDQRVVSALYRASDVLALPSEYEPWALVVNEAVAADMAIVCTDVVGAAPELVRDHVNGFIIPSGSFGAFLDAMLAATDGSTIEQLKAGSKVVLADWQARADPVENLRKLLTRHGIASR